jgi:hypothetical protein
MAHSKLTAEPEGIELRRALARALAAVYSHEDVARLTDADLDQIHGVVLNARRRQETAAWEAAWKATTRRLYWEITGGRTRPAGRLRVVGQEHGWTNTAAWLRLCFPGERGEPRQWEADLRDVAERRGLESVVYGPPSEDLARDFEAHQRDVEQRLRALGYEIVAVAP